MMERKMSDGRKKEEWKGKMGRRKKNGGWIKEEW